MEWSGVSYPPVVNLSLMATSILKSVLCLITTVGCLAVPITMAADDLDTTSKVSLLRVPNGGIQPQAMVDRKGTVHLIYFSGDPRAGDIFYVRSVAGETFSAPIRVNSRPGSAIAIGNGWSGRCREVTCPGAKEVHAPVDRAA